MNVMGILVFMLENIVQYNLFLLFLYRKSVVKFLLVRFPETALKMNLFPCLKSVEESMTSD